MPKNHMGDEHEIILESRMPVANDPEFSVLRMLDGQVGPGDWSKGVDEFDHSNPHTP